MNAGLRIARPRLQGEEPRISCSLPFSNIEDGRKHVADIRERSRLQGREVGIYTVCHVVARETQREADDYYERYAVTLADHGAVDNHMAQKKEFSNSHDKSAFDSYRKRFAGRRR